MDNKKKSDLISCSSCHKSMPLKKIWYVDPELDEFVDVTHKSKKSNYIPFCKECLKRAGYK